MAALGKIRSKGVFLICIIGLGLFGFIAGDMFRSCETTGRERSSRVGEVLGQTIGVQDYQNYVNEFVECTKISSPQANEEQIRSMAWNSFVQNKIIEHEADELGLTVTTDEIRNIMTQGTNQTLMEIANVTGAYNEQTGRFDVNKYNLFMKSNSMQDPDYDKRRMFALFKEKQLRQELLMQKYQALLASCVLSNPVEAKFGFDAENQENDIELAYIDYKSINDKDVKIDDSDLKKKYDERKEMFKIPEEIRAIKYILVNKVASAADKAALNKALQTCADRLKNGEDADKVVREGQSNLAYLGVPVRKSAFSSDIATRLDSMSVGAVVGPVESTADNTLNVIKLISKASLPDSIEFRSIVVAGNTNAETKTKADSVYNAVVGGADFEVIAKKYGQPGQKQWMTTAMYERANGMTKDNVSVFNALNTLAAGETKVIPLTQGSLIIQVTDRRAMVDKYDVAVVKRNIAYSPETSHKYNDDFKQFVAANQSLESMEKNAVKSGYQIMDAKNVVTSQGAVAGIPNSRDALKWVFEAKKNDVSEVMTCGNNRGDQLLVMVLTDIYPKGYMPLDNAEVKEFVQSEVLRDKKAEQIIEKLKDVKSTAQAKAKGAKVTEVKQITFASPVFLSELQAQEPALSGAVAATEKGKFSAHPVKGMSGVYLFQVKDKRTLPGKFDAKTATAKTTQAYLSNLSRTVFQELMINANVKDNRYLFF